MSLYIPAEERSILALLRKPRRGWERRDIPNTECETVAEHSEKVARAVYYYCTSLGLDYQTAYTKALIHDAGEWGKGIDYTPHDNISPQQKFEEEHEAVRELFGGMGERGKELYRLWLQSEKKETEEDKIIYQLDKLDPAVQALVYEARGYKVSEFYPYARAKLSDPYLIKVIDTLYATKEKGRFYDRYFSMLRKGKI